MEKGYGKEKKRSDLSGDCSDDSAGNAGNSAEADETVYGGTWQKCGKYIQYNSSCIRKCRRSGTAAGGLSDL